MSVAHASKLQIGPISAICSSDASDAAASVCGGEIKRAPRLLFSLVAVVEFTVEGGRVHVQVLVTCGVQGTGSARRGVTDNAAATTAAACST